MDYFCLLDFNVLMFDCIIMSNFGLEFTLILMVDWIIHFLILEMLVVKILIVFRLQLIFYYIINIDEI